jgi:hypothetical protein
LYPTLAVLLCGHIHSGLIIILIWCVFIIAWPPALLAPATLVTGFMLLLLLLLVRR